MPLIKPGMYQIETDYSSIAFKIDPLTQLVIAAKFDIDSELAPFITMYVEEIYNAFDTLVHRFEFMFPENKRDYYIEKLGMQKGIAHQVSGYGKGPLCEMVVYFHATDEEKKTYQKHLDTLTDYEKRAFTSRIRS